MVAVLDCFGTAAIPFIRKGPHNYM